MTVKLVVLYTHPDDADAFDRHYLDVHMPLVSKVPGLQRTETGRIVAAADSGELTYYRVTELYSQTSRCSGRDSPLPRGRRPRPTTGRSLRQDQGCSSRP